MLKPGDVVFGKFPMKNGVVLNHYSVVLMANNEGALLAYTTSMKQAGNPTNRFTTDDMRLANWTKPCIWDATQTAVVPNSEMAIRGQVTKVTLSKLLQAYQRARQSCQCDTVMLSIEGEIVYQ
ncbi:MAG: hypothetical protein Q7S87_19330 [Agitococcus sp.]|nr:hypothetical protein [Agitococcus sp.]